MEKTKALTTHSHTPAPIPVEERDGFSEVEFVASFVYLGVLIDCKGTSDPAVLQRIDKARKAFWALNSSVWKVAQLSLSTKMSVYRACVLSVLLFGAETWTPTYPTVRALEKFHMICLRRISNTGLRFQREHSVSNVQLRKWLGAPTIIELVRQARVRWLGHVGHMADHRLPKQLLHGWLPEELGIPRAPGRQRGKLFREVVSADLDIVGLPRRGWLQLCQSDTDRQIWRAAVWQAAVWSKPRQPRAGECPNVTIKSTSRQATVKKRVGRVERVEKAKKHITATLLPESKFLQWEANRGGREESLARIRPVVQALLQDNPELELADLLSQLFSTVMMDDVGQWETEADLALGRLCVASIFYSISRMPPVIPGAAHTGVTPRRIRRKMATPAWVIRKQVQAAAEDPNEARVRAKYFKPGRYVQKQGGQFRCPLPGCGKCYTTRSGLAHHQILQHKEGTFRAEGFNCPQCPRSFDRESALTGHLRKEHVMQSPHVCPFCSGYWPGPSSLRLHIAADHKFEQSEFPRTCPICVKEIGHSEQYRTVHHFKYHLKRCHL